MVRMRICAGTQRGTLFALTYMTYFDTHRHAIYRDLLGYRWTDSVPALAGRNFTHDAYREAAGGRVGRSLYMETGVDDGDYRHEARLAAGWVRDGLFAGQIASCRPEDADFPLWLDECLDMRVSGFRRILHVVPDALSEGRTFRANLRLLARHDLPFELCLKWQQLGIALELARAAPDLRFVLNHCGNPDIAGEAFSAWAEKLSAVAAVGRIAVKLSGLGPNARPDQQTYDAFFPYLDKVVELFGPGRVVWASDWPVSAVMMPLQRWLDISDRFLNGLRPDEAGRIRSGNAVEIYAI